MNATALSRRIAIITFIGGLGGGLVFPILPALGLQLGISGFMVGLILSANRITRLVFNVPAGQLISRLGPRRTMTFALLVEGVAMLGYSAALHFGPPAPWLLGGRVLFGIGTAFMFVGAQAAVLGLSERSDRGRKTATVRFAMSIAMPGGLVLGGVLADAFSVDAAFLAGAGFTFLGSLMAAIALPPLSAAPDTGAPRPRLRQSLAQLLNSSNRTFVGAAWGFNMMVFLTMQGVLLSTMVVLIQKRGISMFGMQAEGTSGLVMAVLIGSSALVSLGVGRLIDKVPVRSILIVPALLGLAAGFAVLAVADSLFVLLVGTILVGLSYNAVTLPMMALLGDSVPDRDYGPAVGVYQFFGDVGGTIGPILGIMMAQAIGLTPLYLGIALIPALSVLAAFWLAGEERRALAASA